MLQSKISQYQTTINHSTYGASQCDKFLSLDDKFRTN
uniref:Uncharacterized protein n=1 Tax=Anopheles atroparvus TaxID=41427 RepID=A0AAG5DT54_ANOAO